MFRRQGKMRDSDGLHEEEGKNCVGATNDEVKTLSWEFHSMQHSFGRPSWS